MTMMGAFGAGQGAIEPNPATTLNQVNNYGRSETIEGGNSEQLVKVQLPEMMAYFVVTVRATVDQGLIGGLPPATVLYPWALVEWGNGNVLTSDLIDCTGGGQITVVGTTVQVTVMMLDKGGNQPVLPVSHTPGYVPPSAKFTAQASIGIVPYPQTDSLRAPAWRWSATAPTRSSKDPWRRPG